MPRNIGFAQTDLPNNKSATVFIYLSGCEGTPPEKMKNCERVLTKNMHQRSSRDFVVFKVWLFEEKN